MAAVAFWKSLLRSLDKNSPGAGLAWYIPVLVLSYTLLCCCMLCLTLPTLLYSTLLYSALLYSTLLYSYEAMSRLD